MLSLQDAFFHTRDELVPVYDKDEATAIAHELLEHITGWGRLQRLTEKNTLLTKKQETALAAALKKAKKGVPLQYITGTQWFLGNPYHVNKYVLIPRPETEELVLWIVKEWRGKSSLRILDIGTGSGCIPIALQLQLPEVKVMSIDISSAALQLAKENALELGAEVDFLRIDFLDMDQWGRLGLFDVIVSNPPYIPISEREEMHTNVKEYEPSDALFVPDNDPLLFYRKIAIFASMHLKKGGAVYCETHRDYAQDSLELFEEMNFSQLELRKDMHGNERMIKACI